MSETIEINGKLYDIAPLAGAPPGPLTGVPGKQRRYAGDYVGNAFAGPDGRAFIKAYNHEKNSVLWFEIRRHE